jgi:hypothetical protein
MLSFLHIFLYSSLAPLQQTFFFYILLCVCGQYCFLEDVNDDDDFWYITPGVIFDDISPTKERDTHRRGL